MSIFFFGNIEWRKIKKQILSRDITLNNSEGIAQETNLYR
jgi:hypothetical protein